jgi:hypothetical protein
MAFRRKNNARSSGVEALDRASHDTPTPSGTRRSQVERAAVGAAGIAAASVIPDSALAESSPELDA